MTWALVESIFLMVVDILLFNAPNVSVPDTKAEKLAAMRRRRRERAIQRWLKKGDKSAPLPRVGLLCSRCNYDLGGLTGDACPECGHAIQIKTGYQV